MSIRPRSLVLISQLLLATVAAVGWCVHAQAAWVERDEKLASRDNVTVTALIAEAVSDEGKALSAPPKHIAIFFPGAEGRVRPAREGVSRHGSRPSTMGLLAEKIGVAVAVGLPSDQPDGIAVSWRLGGQHLADAGAIIDSVRKKYPDAKITLIGMSNGARSVTSVASAVARRGEPKLHGVVVMSAAPEALDESLLASVRAANVPVLVMHHKRDSCLTWRDMESAAKPYPTVLVDDAKHPRPDAVRRECAPGTAHVFAGKEEKVYGLLADWVLNRRVPDGIQ